MFEIIIGNLIKIGYASDVFQDQPEQDQPQES